MPTRAMLFITSMVFSLMACATTHQDDIVLAVENRKDNDGKVIILSGTLRESNGYYNLFSKNGQECVGVLLTDGQKEDYKSLVGRRVTLTGTLEAEGCGRDGICVEHICGPTIMTRITASR